MTQIDTSEPVRPETIKAVPVRHPGRWVSGAIVLVLAAMLVHMLFTNPNLDWVTFGRFFFQGGILKGLTPILPTIDRALTALIEDLDARGLLEQTLVLMLGEFGRSPVMTKDAGREHWTPVMSMLAAGGAGSHGQVVGSTDHKGGEIKSRKVTPSDLAATVFRHLDIPLDSQWVNPQGRPVPVVDRGTPIPELV